MHTTIATYTVYICILLCAFINFIIAAVGLNSEFYLRVSQLNLFGIGRCNCAELKCMGNKRVPIAN